MGIINNSIDSVMGMFSSFIHQGLVGWLVCAIIAFLIFKYVGKSKEITEKYNELTDIMINATKNSNTGELEIDNETLNSIVNDFKTSTKRGTSDINTEVIIEKNLYKEECLKEEKGVKNASSRCIAYGLLGTFLGLTMAIMQTRGVLGDTLGSTRMFGKAMEAPFASMSTAFWTSIFGVLASVILNIKNIKMENSKDSFYDNMEDYLDNTIYSIYAVNLITQFNEFNKTVESSMKQLTGEVTYLFREGIETLVSDINKNNLDLTTTVNGLTKYTRDLERLTESLDKSVNNFKDPVDKFKTSIEEYIQSSEMSSNRIKESTDKFSGNVEMLDRSLRDIENVISNNKKELEDVGKTIEYNLKSISSRQEDLINSAKEVVEQDRYTKEEMIKEVQNIGQVYSNLTSTLNGFNSQFKLTQQTVGKEMSDIMSKGLNDVSNEIISRINTSLNQVETSSEKLSIIVEDVAKMSKETNDLNTFVIKKINMENNDLIEKRNIEQKIESKELNDLIKVNVHEENSEIMNSNSEISNEYEILGNKEESEKNELY